MKHQNCNDEHRLSLQTAVNCREYFGISALCWVRTCTRRRKAKVQRKRRSWQRLQSSCQWWRSYPKIEQYLHTAQSCNNTLSCTKYYVQRITAIHLTNKCMQVLCRQQCYYLVTVGFHSDVTYSNKQECLALGSDAMHLQKDTKWSRSYCQWKANDAISAKTTITNYIETSWISFTLSYNVVI